MKKILAYMITLLMIIALFATPVSAQEFTDVKENDYYSEAVTILSEAGIITGYEDSTFRPQNYVTRAEMVAIICRAMNKEESARMSMGYTTDFSTDVPANHWASGYVVCAVANDIILGDGNGKFRPNDYVRYEEAIKMIVCAIGLGEYVTHDPDNWAAGYIRMAKIHGFADTYISCKEGEYINRADIAVLISNAIKDKLHKITITGNGIGTSNFDELNKRYFAGSVITLKVTPKKGFAFMGWNSDGGEFSYAGNEITEFIMPHHDVIINAVFFRTN